MPWSLSNGLFGQISNANGGRIQANPLAGAVWDDEAGEYVLPNGKRIAHGTPEFDALGSGPDNQPLYRPITGINKYLSPDNTRFVDQQNASFQNIPTLTGAEDRAKTVIGGQHFRRSQAAMNSGIGLGSVDPATGYDLTGGNSTAANLAATRQSLAALANGSPELANNLNTQDIQNALETARQFGANAGPTNEGQGNAIRQALASSRSAMQLNNMPGESENYRKSLVNQGQQLDTSLLTNPLNRRYDIANTDVAATLAEARRQAIPQMVDTQQQQLGNTAAEAQLAGVESGTKLANSDLLRRTIANEMLGQFASSELQPGSAAPFATHLSRNALGGVDVNRLADPRYTPMMQAMQAKLGTQGAGPVVKDSSGNVVNLRAQSVGNTQAPARAAIAQPNPAMQQAPTATQASRAAIAPQVAQEASDKIQRVSTSDRLRERLAELDKVIKQFPKPMSVDEAQKYQPLKAERDQVWDQLLKVYNAK